MRQGAREGDETRGETGHETGGKTGSETGARQGARQGQDRERDRGKTEGKTGQNEIILSFRVSTYSGEVSPPPANRTTIPYTFTELQKAFVGPHHGPKSLGQK